MARNRSRWGLVLVIAVLVALSVGYQVAIRSGLPWPAVERWLLAMPSGVRALADVFSVITVVVTTFAVVGRFFQDWLVPSRGAAGRVLEASPALYLAPARRLPRRSAGLPLISLLVERYDVVRFRGRGTEREALKLWLGSESRRAVRLIAAEGGAGKSRLARKIGDDAAKEGWIVLFCLDEVTDTGTSRRRAVRHLKKVLVIVDDADRLDPSRTGALRMHLGSSNGVVRILLLSRSDAFWRHERHEWETADFVADSQPVTLLDQKELAELWSVASEDFARELEVDPALVTAAPVGLLKPGQSVLEVLVGALLCVADLQEPSGPSDLSFGRPAGVGAFEKLLEREQAMWFQIDADEWEQDRIRLLVLIAAATGELPGSTASGLLRHLGFEDAKRLLYKHAGLYPPRDQSRQLAPLRPDRLAEEYIGACVATEPSGDGKGSASTLAHAEARDLLLRLMDLTQYNDDGETGVTATWAKRAVTTVIEAGRYHPHLCTQVLDPVFLKTPSLALIGGGSGMARYAEVTTSVVALRQIQEALESASGSGRHLEYDAGGVAILERLIHLTSPSGKEEAELMTPLANRLSAIGRREDALRPARRAVEILEHLEATESGLHLKDLASALESLSYCLSSMAQWDEALEPARQAVTIRRGLATTRRPDDRAGLAQSLINLANRLWALGQPQKALAEVRKAVKINSDLMRIDSQAYMPDLGKSLGFLAEWTTEDGNAADALAPAKQTVDIYESLVATQPSKYLPDLAWSLVIYARALSGLGRNEEALGFAKKAEAEYVRAAEAQPTAYRPDFAWCLYQYANCLLTAEQADQASKTARRSVEIYDSVPLSHRAVFVPDLARALTVLARSLSAQDRVEEAVEQAARAVEILDELATIHPAAFHTELDHSLETLALAQERLG